MIFERLTIQNMFSYYGEQTFKFPKPTEKKPIVLIAGRNGYGKTSFINCVKLLFLGTSNVMLRGAQAGHTLIPRTYLMGVDRVWQGVFNHQAREEGQPRYGVSLAWREEKGVVTVHRYWKIVGNEPEPHVHIELDFEEAELGEDGQITDPEEVEEFLQRRLPRDIVPFFFYDGEKIQQLAEENQQGLMSQIELVLGLAAVDIVDEYLERAIKSWKRDGTAASEQAELDTLNATNQLKLAERSKFQAEIDEINAEIENLDREIRRHTRQIDLARNQALQRDSTNLRKKASDAAERYETACQNIALSLPAVAPLWATPRLVEKIAEQLQGAVSNPSQQLAEEIRGIFDRLPMRLFDEPPHPTPKLNDAQKAHYKKKLSAVLSQYTEPPSGGFFSLNPEQTITLKRRIDYYSQAGAERERIANDLRQTVQLRREWQQAKLEAEAVEELSPKQKQLFAERQAVLTELKERHDALLEQLGKARNEVSHADTELARISAQIAQQETRLVKASINSQHIRRAQQAQHVFESYRQSLKESRRTEIEAALNDSFKKLMTSHQQINRIRLSDDFALSYLDKNGREIGLSNVSAGMKQLTAQALLWALSIIADRNIPVIVDTPLARIDRLHQENLLRNYYPNAAQQVIVLPTDSEIDKDKYLALRPRVCGEFRLENPDGEHTRVVADTPMYAFEEI